MDLLCHRMQIHETPHDYTIPPGVVITTHAKPRAGLVIPRQPVFVGAAFPLARCRRGLIYQVQNGCRCVVADDGSQRDAAGHGIGGGDAITGVGAMNRAPTICHHHCFPSPTFVPVWLCHHHCSPSPAPAPIRLCHHHRSPSPRPRRFGHAASGGFLRAAFPLARCRRGRDQTKHRFV